MTTKVRPYLSAFRVRALLETQYRGAAFGGMITNTAFALILVSLYRALYAGNDPAALKETVTYVWLQQIFFRALMATDGELNGHIMSGNIAYMCVRPLDLQLWWACRDLAAKVMGSLMRILPILLLQFVLPDDLRMALPASPVAFLQYLISLGLGMICLAELSGIGSAFTMITLDSKGITAMLNLLLCIFCGNIIPLTLFPERFQTLIRYQPFAQALDAPIRMYLHAQSFPEFALNLGIQILWILILTLLGRKLWQRNLDRMVIQGG